MFDFHTFALGLAVIATAALLMWIVSYLVADVSIVDSLWGPLFLFASAVYALAQAELSDRALVVLALVGIWSVRLSAYITWRNHGEPEDARYRAIRNRNEPYFGIKSIYLVFGFQALLAWIISLPLLAAIASPRPWGWLDTAGIALWCFGIAFESIADAQLVRFKGNPRNRGRVLDRGLWRYTRHPNYFGEFACWWGTYLVAVSAGGWWSVVSPLLMSLLLLRVSGVTLLEKDIGDRRPDYAEYKRRTNAFFPGPPRTASR
jgi:steroid 5-alpha reductase family enzyme